MEKRVLYGLVVMLMYLVDNGFSQVELQRIRDEATWEDIMQESQLPIVVTVRVKSSLCGVPCAILEDQVAQLAKTFGDQILLYKNDLLEEPFFAQLYKVLNAPTVLIFKDGKEIIRYEELSDWGKIFDLILESIMFRFAPPPSDSASALPPQSGD